MAYSEQLIDHYENPRNVGSFAKDDESVGTGLVGAPACGDVMKLQIKVNDQGVIEDAKFKTFGCGSAIASSSLVTEWVKGKSIDEAATIKNNEIAQHLSLPPVKIHCSILAEDAIKAAVNDYKFTHGMLALPDLMQMATALFHFDAMNFDVSIAEPHLRTEMGKYEKFGYSLDWTSLAQASVNEFVSNLENFVSQEADGSADHQAMEDMDEAADMLHANGAIPADAAIDALIMEGNVKAQSLKNNDPRRVEIRQKVTQFLGDYVSMLQRLNMAVTLDISSAG